MNVTEDNWLSQVFGYPVFRVDVPAGADETTLSETLGAHAQKQTRAFYFTKIETGNIESIRSLSNAGMFVVDVNVVFRLDRAPRPTSSHFLVNVREVRAENTEAVLAIAESAFRYSRFHLDPLVGGKLADRIKRAWIHSYIRKTRGDKLLVGLVDGRPAGFLAAITTESEGKHIGVIDLIAVSREYRQKRVGQAMVMTFSEAYRPQCDALQVGTQVANTASIRFYEKLGFSVHRSQYVLHMHVANGKAI